AAGPVGAFEMTAEHILRRGIPEGFQFWPQELVRPVAEDCWQVVVGLAPAKRCVLRLQPAVVFDCRPRRSAGCWQRLRLLDIAHLHSFLIALVTLIELLIIRHGSARSYRVYFLRCSGPALS